MSDINYAEILNQGGNVAIPTETVYGLAAKINDSHAIDSIFRIKKRPSFDPLIVHVANLDQIKPLVDNFELYEPIIQVAQKEFWPGPLTLVLPKSEDVSTRITAGLNTVAIRVPNHPLTLSLLEKLNAPLAAPSANLFGKVSPTTAAHVKKSFPDLPVLDGGSCEVGLESSIIEVELLKPSLYQLVPLRPGKITFSRFSQVLVEQGINVVVGEKQKSMAPGGLENHYQPEKPIVVKIVSSFDEVQEQNDREQIVQLDGDELTFARDLYSLLREFDENSQYEKLVFYIEKKQLENENWFYIFDRLKKASSLWVGKTK